MKRDKFGRFAPTTKRKTAKKSAKKSVKRPVKKRKAAPSYKIGDLVFVRANLGYEFCNKMRELGIPAKIVNKADCYFKISYGMIAGSNSEYTTYMTPDGLEKASTPDRGDLGNFMDFNFTELKQIDDGDDGFMHDGKECIEIGCNAFTPEHFKGFNAVVRAIMMQQSDYSFGESFMTAFKQAIAISFKAEVIAK